MIMMFMINFLTAHEFFDALAVNKFQKVDGEWREVLVDVDETGERLRYIISRNATPSCILMEREGVRDLVKDRNMVEMSSPGWNIVRQISEESRVTCVLLLTLDLFNTT